MIYKDSCPGRDTWVRVAKGNMGVGIAGREKDEIMELELGLSIG